VIVITQVIGQRLGSRSNKGEGVPAAPREASLMIRSRIMILALRISISLSALGSVSYRQIARFRLVMRQIEPHAPRCAVQRSTSCYRAGPTACDIASCDAVIGDIERSGSKQALRDAPREGDQCMAGKYATRRKLQLTQDG